MAEKFPGRSPYEYCFSNPINYTDPTGMSPEGDGGGDPKKTVVWKKNDNGEIELPGVVVTSELSKARRADDSDRRTKPEHEYNDVDLKFAKAKLTEIAKDGRKYGYNFAAHNLEHFLSNKGTKVNVKKEFLLTQVAAQMLKNTIFMLKFRKKRA